MAKKSSAPTKSDILAAISKDTGLSKKQVSAVFDSLNTVIRKSLKSNSLWNTGEFSGRDPLMFPKFPVLLRKTPQNIKNYPK